MKIAIAGYGVEGKASLVYWNTAEHEITVVDEREVVEDIPQGIPRLLGAGAFGKLESFDLVIRTAGLAPRKIVTSGKVWSATNEFFALCPAPIIGVTGTKGKGTTASLIASMLRAAGKTVHLVGNIGVSALEVLPDVKSNDIVVYELSSFQLWDLEKSPHIAVVLMIEPDHLDVHESFEEYVEAKSNIRSYQQEADTCIYHPTSEWSRHIALAGKAKGQARRYAIQEDGQAYIKQNTFFVQDEAICSVESLQLPGAHNQENACAAISAVRCFTTDNQAIERGLRDFKGLPHRLEYVDSVSGVDYYDDSFSSATPATKVAVNSFEGSVILIAGGYDRGIDYTDFAQELAHKSNLKHVILLGQTGPRIASLLKSNDYQAVTEVTTLKEAVEHAQDISEAGDTVVMSPGCASFDMFKNFIERGEQFKHEVHLL